MRSVRISTRCRVAGYGWLHLKEAESKLLDGGPSMINEDPRQSGQNPEYTSWGVEQIRSFINQPHYRQQLEQRIAEVSKEREHAIKSVSAQQADVDRLTAQVDELQSMLNTPCPD